MKKKRFFTITTKTNLKGFLFIVPWLVGFCAFFAYPLSQSLLYSMSKITITAKGRRITPVGWDNFIYIFQRDIYFMERIRTFFANTLFSLPVIVVFSLMLAILINQRIHLKGFFRTLFFLPIIVVSGPVMQMLINEGATTIPLIEQYGIYGIINELPYFLIEPVSYLFGRLIMILWYSGVPILIFLAGLQKIDTVLYEAALIDGASAWVAFWKITLPALRNMILINTIYTLVFLATSEVNEVIDLIRSNMMSPDKGYGIASAMAWAYTVGIALALGVCFLIVGRDKPVKEKHAVILYSMRHKTSSISQRGR